MISYKFYKMLWNILIIAGVLLLIFYFFTVSGMTKIFILGILLYVSGIALLIWVQLIKVRKEIETIKQKMSKTNSSLR